MGWEDRPYYRDRSSGPVGVLQWLASGSVSLGTWFGIHVRMHAAMIVFIGLTLLFRGLGTWQNTLTSMAILFVIVLLHEFGHCIGSRLVGGNPTQILMHPFGGLASADPPHRPWPTFFTVLAGPLVNVLICLVAGIVTAALVGTWRVLPWNPMAISMKDLVSLSATRSVALYYTWWVFSVSYFILIFNLLPIFPLDGGQLVQSALWAKYGYYRATMFASVTGMVGGGLLAIYGLVHYSLFTVLIAAWGFQFCLYKYRELKANGPWAYEDEFDYGLTGPFGKSSMGATATAKEPSARALRKAAKLENEAKREQEEIDAILAKVSAHGMHSLTWLEKRALHKATERQRRRDAEISRSRRGR